MRIRQRWVRIFRVVLILGLVVVALAPVVTIIKFQIVLHHPVGQMQRDTAKSMLDNSLAVWLAMRKFNLWEYGYATWMLRETPQDIDEQLQGISASESEELSRRFIADSILYYRTGRRVHLENIYAKVRKGGSGNVSGGRRELLHLLLRKDIPYEDAAFLETLPAKDLEMTEDEFGLWLDGFLKGP